MNKTPLQADQYQAQVYNDNIEEKKEDKGLLLRIKDRVKAYESMMQELREKADTNTKYYFGDYLDDSELRVEEEAVVIPRAFTNWETLIPIITRNVPEPNLTVVAKKLPEKNSVKDYKDLITQRKKKSIAKLNDLLPQFLKNKWLMSKVDGGADMQRKMEESFRNLATQGIIIFKLKYNSQFNVLDPVVVSVNDCIFNIDATDETELAFFGHYCTYTIKELLDKGIEEEKIEELKILLAKEKDDVSEKTVVKLLEYWEAEMVVLEYKEALILGKFANPLYDFKNKEKNHFSVPLIPVIMESDIRLNSGLLSKSTTIEVGQSLLRNMDKRKRNINRNLKLANGIMVVDGNANISREDAEALSSDTDKTIYMEKGAKTTSREAVHVVTARPIDNSVIQDMMHTEDQFDKLTGVNETVRGERTSQETAEGRRLLKESALSRNEVLFRVNERIGQKFYSWTLQALYVYCKEGGEPVYTSKGNYSYAQIIEPDILKEAKILCYVKDGSTVPLDKSTIEAQAIERFKLGLYSKRRVLEILGDVDPIGTARESFLEQTQPQLLYDQKLSQNKYHPEAIMGIYETIKGEVQVPISMPKDEATAEKYLATYNDYIDNISIDEDLPNYSSLDTEIQRRVQELVFEQSSLIAEFVAQQRALNPQPNMPMNESMQPPMPETMEGMQPNIPNMPMGESIEPQMPEMLSNPSMNMIPEGFTGTPAQGMSEDQLINQALLKELGYGQ